jgi:hypothetical protein
MEEVIRNGDYITRASLPRGGDWRRWAFPARHRRALSALYDEVAAGALPNERGALPHTRVRPRNETKKKKLVDI